MASEKLTKNKICESAVSLYVEDPSRFSITSLAKELSVPVQIFIKYSQQKMLYCVSIIRIVLDTT